MKKIPHGAAAARKAHNWKAEKDGHYVEPCWVSERLFEVEKFEGEIIDPCCGWGRIVISACAAGYRAFGSDIQHRGFGTQYDFLKMNSRETQNIVCNPPYHLIKEFTLNALEVATNKVAMIWLTRRLNAARWLEGTPLTRIWLLTPRPSMPPGSVVKQYASLGQEPSGGTQDFCWLVWDHTAQGPKQTLRWPEIRWLKRDA